MTDVLCPNTEKRRKTVRKDVFKFSDEKQKKFLRNCVDLLEKSDKKCVK